MKLSTILSTVCSATTALAAFDYNRAGAVLKAPAGESFANVSGTFTVPALSGNSRLSIWVGIGDSIQQNYVLGGGIVFNKTLATWSAFYPDKATDLTAAVPVAASDSITVTVSIAGTSGSVTVENKTQNKKSTQTVAAPAAANPEALTALAADWWVQGYQVVPGELITTPNYGSVAFTACSATTESGVNVPLTGAGTFEISGISGQQYSKTTVTGTGITVQRV
ncbi:concanavalin A-like lectin/glucanase [Melanomma pulvis-pyrius CBS 109.77]|uniref:Concanavalin A-like lectin/glucanase n=1 Tax=Melanomma pulvis-pyrius CBS 109.77 TaxID=1314802 RepID=A0A6A6WRS0_9PLEO|nr:concanavalin A-like lectin/glucanase [Melanomma pulvis-pyrius CBS 109.77]